MDAFKAFGIGVAAVGVVAGAGWLIEKTTGYGLRVSHPALVMPVFSVVKPASKAVVAAPETPAPDVAAGTAPAAA